MVWHHAELHVCTPARALRSTNRLLLLQGKPEAMELCSSCPNLWNSSPLLNILQIFHCSWLCYSFCGHVVLESIPQKGISNADSRYDLYYWPEELWWTAFNNAVYITCWLYYCYSLLYVVHFLHFAFNCFLCLLLWHPESFPWKIN